jgi:hypothetical protein
MGGSLLIRDNDQLNDISSLSNMDATSILNLGIFYNPSLSKCAIESICNYLSETAGGAGIYDNAVGCNAPEEVIDSCLTRISENTTRNFYFEIFPNPSRNGFITLSVKGYTKYIQISCYNTYGHRVYKQRTKSSEIDIHTGGWKAGVYFIEIKADDTLLARSKFAIIN